MARKKSGNKVSCVKRANRLRTKLLKQGKSKTRRNRSKSQKKSAPIRSECRQTDEAQDNSENEDDVLDMIEDEDISFLQNAVANQSYSFLKNIKLPSDKINSSGAKRKAEALDELEEFESQYEQMLQSSDNVKKKKKYLLPIKTSKGIVARSEEVNSSEDETPADINKQPIGNKKYNNSSLFQEIDNADEIRNVDLLAYREGALAKKKFRIGILCSGLTETPVEKIHNFKPLLEMLSNSDPEISITIKKLALVSLLEVFKDLIPEYQIKHHNDPNVKLKKTVKQLQGFEDSLLKYYKGYLKEIEKIVSILKRKKGDNRIVSEVEVKLVETALKCLCEILIAHPYFNFSKNIIHLLVPLLNNGRESIREIVSGAIKAVFKSDKKGDLSLETVRFINKFVKKKKNVVHKEVLMVLLSLNLKDVNLDKEKEEEIKRKKEEAKRHKLLKLSKREKKKLKKAQVLQKDLLETKAEENKKSKEQCMTEITKTIFTIYFRILKETPSTKLLNAALEGLAKFAHCINVDFYHDLIIVLDNLIQNENLGYKEKLCCVCTVFTVLHYQGASIYIDPVRFYSHYYANILQIDAGVNHSDLSVILKTTDFVLLKRRKHLSLQRLLAFTKRLTALALQVLPNGSLALLSLIKEILKVNNSTDILLDFENVQGQGVYYPELDEPEYCNAGATSLWELLLLQKHYHPTVQEFASHLAKSGSNPDETSQVKSLFKQSAEQLFEDFATESVKFNPAIPTPRKFAKTKRKGQHFLNRNLEDDFKIILKKAKFNVESYF